jgi:Flp pilus assembly pilin Flp
MIKLLRCVGMDETAASAVEYGLIAAGIALAIIAVLISTARHLPT